MRVAGLSQIFTMRVRVLLAFAGILGVLIVQSGFAIYTFQRVIDIRQRARITQQNLLTCRYDLSAVRVNLCKLLGATNPDAIRALQSTIDQQFQQLAGYINTLTLPPDFFAQSQTTYQEIIALYQNTETQKAHELMRTRSDREYEALLEILSIRAHTIETAAAVTLRRANRQFISSISLLGVIGVLLALFWEWNVFRLNQQLTRESEERTHIAEALRASEERFRLVIDNSRDGINLLDLTTGRYTFMSSAQVELTGFSIEEMNNFSVEEAYARVHPDDREISITQQKQVAAGADLPTPVEYRWKVKSGEYRWFSDSRKVIRDEQGRAIALVGISRDITEHKRAEEALHESEERFRVAQEVSLQAFTIMRSVRDAHGQIIDFEWTYANPMSDEILKQPSGTLVGQRLLDILPGNRENRALFDRYVRIVETGQGDEMELEYASEGISGWFRNMAVKLGDGVAVSFSDITDRKRAEEALRESERNIRSILLNAKGFFIYRVVVDKTAPNMGQVVLVSPSITEIAGITDPSNFLAWFEHIHPDDMERASEANRISAETGVPYDQSVRWYHKLRQEWIWVRTISNPVFNEEGRVTHFNGLCFDITDQKRAEEQIKNQNVLLEQAVQQKQQEMEALFERLLRQEKLATIGQMAGSIAHELRNPLGAVKQAVYYLKRLAQMQELTASNPDVLRQLNLMDTELDTSARVITNLLDLTRMKPLQRQLTGLRPLIEDAVRHCQLPPQVRVSIALEPRPFVIYADPLQIRQVLLNVLTNAAQAIEGDGTITVAAQQFPAQAESIITIHDTGIGLTPEAFSHVFDPLYTTKAAGTGLGLSICKQIIESHQGRISLTSQPDQGTTVTIVLPIEGNEGGSA